MRLNRKPGRFFVLMFLGAVFIAVVVWDVELAGVFKLGSGQGSPAPRFGFWLGHGLLVLPPLVLAWMAGRRFRRPRLKAAAGRAFWAFIASGLAAQLLKHLFGRPRPRLLARGITEWSAGLTGGMDSFPSGHTSTSVAVACVLAYFYPGAAPLFMMWAAFVAASRLLGGSHFPTDVLGGVLLGLGTAWVLLRNAGPSGKERP